MKLPFKPHLFALLCSAGLLAASGALFVKSQTPAAVNETAPVAPAQTQPAATASAPNQPTPVTPVSPTYTAAQIDQWVAPVALYPDALLSQILMAATYPANVLQAVQWSRDNPRLQGDAAIEAAKNQPWDASVKSLVAFPQLMSLLGENPQWVQNLGDAFLAQPNDVMDSVQRLRALAQQTGALTSTAQQKVTTTTKAATPAPTKEANGAAPQPASSPTIIKIEPADPQVVYVPTYNPATVYGTWPNASYPPVYLPPTPGEQFGESFVKGLGYSLGVATTYALFSSIDWDDDDHDDHHHGDGYYHDGDNININVNNFNKITGEHRVDNALRWQHNPAYRNGVPYSDNRVATQYRANAAASVNAVSPKPVNRDSQRQAAMAQLQQAAGKNRTSTPRPATKDAQRQAANQQLKQIAQRNNYRGYDTDKSRAQQQANRPQKTQRANKPQREAISAARPSPTRYNTARANALSGNDSRSASWQAQQQRGMLSRQYASTNRERAPARERRAENRDFNRHR